MVQVHPQPQFNVRSLLDTGDNDMILKWNADQMCSSTTNILQWYITITEISNAPVPM